MIRDMRLLLFVGFLTVMAMNAVLVWLALTHPPQIVDSYEQEAR
jgi:hypothetical protein